MDLFDHAMKEEMEHDAPLAARLRPRTLDEFVGQEHIIGEGRLLRRAIIADRLFSSIIFTGPPGTGKTTLARLIAQNTQAHFESISAVLAGVADLRKVIAEATDRRRLYRRRTLLFESTMIAGFLTARSFFESTAAFYGVDLLLFIPAIACVALAAWTAPGDESPREEAAPACAS